MFLFFTLVACGRLISLTVYKPQERWFPFKCKPGLSIACGCNFKMSALKNIINCTFVEVTINPGVVFDAGLNSIDCCHEQSMLKYPF